jgi:hypothetical protein
MHARAALTIADLDDVLVETTNILNIFSQLLDGTLSVPMLPGSDDYQVILELAAKVSNLIRTPQAGTDGFTG